MAGGQQKQGSTCVCMLCGGLHSFPSMAFMRSTIRYGAYEPIKSLLTQQDSGGSSSSGGAQAGMPLWKKVAAGGAAGAIGAAGATPSDLIKVRMQAYVAADEAAIVAHMARPPPAGVWRTAAHMWR